MASLEFLRCMSYFIPRGGDRVFKDECLLCYDSPYSDGGIFVSFSTLQGFCKEHVKLFTQKHGKEGFLHLMKVPRPVAKALADEPAAKKPTKLAIGVEDGFDLEKDKVQYDDVNSVVILNHDGSENAHFQLPNQELPEMVLIAVKAILDHQGNYMNESVASWEEDKRKVSKHADSLLQLDNGVKIPPRGWKCSKCDMVENLWMNLTDGTILCGRRYFDGSGGNNHAVEYYQETKYPLAVKLGTITQDGADVYSYDEDDMVEDCKIKEHLAHFGINIKNMEKTDKTMTELEIEANLKIKAEWDTIQEAGKKLKPLFGGSYTGMINLGNSCYINSVMQVLFSIEEVISRYNNPIEDVYLRSNSNPAEDFEIQITKLANGLLSGKYSPAIETELHEIEGPEKGIRPLMFKSLVGRGHPEFSTNRQQDAHEYFLHLLSLISKKEHFNSPMMNIQRCFAFQYETRLVCLSSNKVSYSQREDVSLLLPVPLDKATNTAEYIAFEARKKEKESRNEKMDPSELVRLKVPFMSCLEAFADPEQVDNFFSSAINAKTEAMRTTRFATFPEYLVIQPRRFTVDDTWTIQKLDVSIDVPDTLDISHLKGNGLQPGEEELPDTNEAKEPKQEINIDENIVGELAMMGFPIEGCRKAVYYTGNSGAEAAMEWVFEHSNDADFAEKLELPSASKTPSSSFTPSEDALMMIQGMGFSMEHAVKALKATDNNLERALEWIFNHTEELNTVSMDVDNGEQVQIDTSYIDGPGKYRLFAFVSHMGTSPSCGHYVCHIFKEGRWVIYNDRKVAVSERPPMDLAYLYFYKRDTAL